MPGRILIIDDEQDMLNLLRRIITEETDHELVTERNPVRAMEVFRDNCFDLVITDLRMPGTDGIKILDEVKRIRPGAYVLVMTAFATIETAVDAIRRGAFDYISKPFRRERILIAIDKIMKWQEIVNENSCLREALAETGSQAFLVGATPVMNEIFERFRQVAPTTATVMLTGASGTGKELAARFIHHNSLRKSMDFVAINCTAIPEQIMESELFGHVKGAFTGAFKDKKGLVELAHEGTLFLDEIGDLNPHLQTKLLRLLQEGEYKPVGSEITLKADLRIIAATSHDLKTRIQEKHFREDLYYRLNVIQFEMPSLKDRRTDIPLLSSYFFNKYTKLHRKTIRDISPVAMQSLIDYDYPGNIRELENIIERGVVFCRTEIIETGDLFFSGEHSSFFVDSDRDIARFSYKEAKDKTIDIFHRQYIQSLLRKTGGNMTKAAEIAGIQRQYLYRLLKEAGIEPGEYRDDGES